MSDAVLRKEAGVTLAPVFRSAEGLRLLLEGGVLDRLAPALAIQRAAVASVDADLPLVIPPDWILERAELSDPEALQTWFFLTLFISVFDALGVPPERLRFYAEVDYCIQGTIVAADDLFDGEGKGLLPLKTQGPTFSGILQLMCFERLMSRAGRRAVDQGLCSADDFDGLQRDLLAEMASIGKLEGSEEGGVDTVLTPEVMLEAVHAVRGGQLFGLSLAAVRRLETDLKPGGLERASLGLVTLGTAFQVVDDLTDFEHDLKRGSHNLLESWVHHRGTPSERAVLARLRAGAPAPPKLVEDHFGTSARAVLDEARELVRQAFAHLRALGFAFSDELADRVVLSIAGLEGTARMQRLAATTHALA